jgi:hypothetical protein
MYYDRYYDVYPGDLVIGKTYVWKMGAEDIDCIYVGRGEKHFTYVFQLGTERHNLSYGDVRRWIANKEVDFYQSPDMCVEV